MGNLCDIISPNIWPKMFNYSAIKIGVRKGKANNLGFNVFKNIQLINICWCHRVDDI